MAKLKMYVRHRKYFVGDGIEYRVSNEIRHGIIVKTPYVYACDTNEFRIDFYIVSDVEEYQVENEMNQFLIPQYRLISVSSINGKIE